jgi:uncharacterized protein (TIGR03435 family)
MRMLIVTVALLGIVSGPGQEQPSAVQAPPAETKDAAPVFDVAAIHENRKDQSGRSHIWSSATEGDFRTENVTAMELVQWAFNMPDSRIRGGPPWMRTARFDIDARPDPALNDRLRSLDAAQAREIERHMVRSLLADRFALKTHEESRVEPVYDLVVAKGGPKFQAAQVNGTTINGGKGQMHIGGSDHTVALLAEQLARLVGRVVVDKTGMDGRFDLTLTWTPDETSNGASEASGDSGGGPSIFTALQEQLGLKLKPAKGPVPILVIDQMERPSQN